MAWILPLWILFFPAELWAASLEPTDLFFSGLKMFIGMIVVVGLMLLVYVLNRKGIGFLKKDRTGRINIVEMRHLGGRKMLCMVEVKGRELLLGLGNDHIDFLYDFSDSPAHTDFANELQRHVEAEK
jgi:flagellar protein FliO/FliZ